MIKDANVEERRKVTYMCHVRYGGKSRKCQNDLFWLLEASRGRDMLVSISIKTLAEGEVILKNDQKTICTVLSSLKLNVKIGRDS